MQKKKVFLESANRQIFMFEIADIFFYNVNFCQNFIYFDFIWYKWKTTKKKINIISFFKSYSKKNMQKVWFCHGLEYAS